MPESRCTATELSHHNPILLSEPVLKAWAVSLLHMRYWHAPLHMWHEVAPQVPGAFMLARERSLI